MTKPIHLLTTSSVFSTYVRREQRTPANVRWEGKDSSGDPVTYYTTGRLEAAIEAGFRPVVVSSRHWLGEHDAWWTALVEAAEGGVHIMDHRGDGAELTEFCIPVLYESYGIAWPMAEPLARPGEEGFDAEDFERQPMFWTGGFKHINEQQAALLGGEA